MKKAAAIYVAIVVALITYGCSVPEPDTAEYERGVHCAESLCY